MNLACQGVEAWQDAALMALVRASREIFLPIAMRIGPRRRFGDIDHSRCDMTKPEATKAVIPKEYERDPFHHKHAFDEVA